MADTKNVYQRLLAVQQELVAPREVSGKFGKARSAEQILEAAKPVCNKHGLFLQTTDSITRLGERNYIVTTARVINTENTDEFVEADAYAWENEVELSASGRPILDTSQVSGKTSSYSKKYALQNLFAIDDTKDHDHKDSTPKSDDPLDPLQDELVSLMEGKFSPAQIRAAIGKLHTEQDYRGAIAKMKGTTK